MNRIARAIIMCALTSMSLHLSAQTTWPSPEVERMYKEARDLHSQGKLQPAIKMYLQALNIAPEVMILYRDLGQAYYLTGAYQNAKETLDPVIKHDAADEQTFQIMAATLTALNDRKKARSILQKGLEKYPHSGLLYHDLGAWYEADQNMEDALKAWLDGIEADPAYHVNYYEAARAYMYSNKPPIWSIIYGEIFINIEQQTPRANETRTMLLAAYRKLFNSVLKAEPPKFKGKKGEEAESSFEQAVYDVYMKLAPVVTDGITTENLTMLRTRFMMDWTLQHSGKYPFSLFYRQDKMIRDGYFDIYNQWLFGRAENQQQFEAWKQFHPDDLPDFEEWLQDNKYRPAAGDFYNKKEVKGIFSRK
jgi:tetratricopeptide (TPR) repeat protein